MSGTYDQMETQFLSEENIAHRRIDLIFQRKALIECDSVPVGIKNNNTITVYVWLSQELLFCNFTCSKK